MSDRDKGNLLVIVDSCLKIKKFVDNIRDADAFLTDEKTFDAVLMNFVIIGEAAGKLTDELKEREQQIPCIKIRGFRNIVAHNYFGVDAEEVWQIIKDNPPELEKQIQKIIN